MSNLEFERMALDHSRGLYVPDYIIIKKGQPRSDWPDY